MKAEGETKRALQADSCLYQSHTEREKERARVREKERAMVGGRSWGLKEGGSYFIFIQEAQGKECHDSPRPLDTAALPVLNQSQRLQLMAKIRNNHRLPLIILN